jgi:hypothetical protein
MEPLSGLVGTNRPDTLVPRTGIFSRIALLLHLVSDTFYNFQARSTISSPKAKLSMPLPNEVKDIFNRSRIIAAFS